MRPPVAGRPDPKRREPLWDRVDANRLRLVAFLVLFAAISSIALTVAIAFAALLVAFLESLFITRSFTSSVTYDLLLSGGLLRPWLLGLALGICYEFWSLSRSEKWLLRRLHADFVPKGELLDTKLALKDMAVSAGLPMAPALYLVSTPRVNAFVYKAPGRRPVLGVTQGLIDLLNTDQQRAVFANLVARIVSGDTLVSSAVTSLMAPLQFYRAHRLRMLDVEDRMLATMAEETRSGVVIQTSDGPQRTQKPSEVALGSLFLLPFLLPALFLGEVVAAVQRRSQLTAAEKADAEGMLLLKDPSSMVSALERCVIADNLVVEAGEAVGDLFYCWTGSSTNDEDDPEWKRVARLREVLGVDGWVPDDESGDALEDYLPGPAPRIGR